MKTKYLKLTKEQRGRGVCFSSLLGGTIHEITDEEYRDNPVKAEEKEERLRDVSFFKGWGEDTDGGTVHEIRTK